MHKLTASFTDFDYIIRICLCQTNTNNLQGFYIIKSAHLKQISALCFNGLLSLSHFCEAVAAIYRSVCLRLKRYTSFAAACCTCSYEILLRSSCGILASVTASLASLRLILEASFSIKFLFAGCEYELFSALFAFKCFVLVHLFYLSLFCPWTFFHRICIEHGWSDNIGHNLIYCFNRSRLS